MRASRRERLEAVRQAREGFAALLGKHQVTTRLQQDTNQLGGARATGPTRTGDYTDCSDTASAEKADAWAVPTIAFETGERFGALGSSDNESATGRHDGQVSAYLPVCIAMCVRSSAARQRYVVLRNHITQITVMGKSRSQEDPGEERHMSVAWNFCRRRFRPRDGDTLHITSASRSIGPRARVNRSMSGWTFVPLRVATPCFVERRTAATLCNGFHDRRDNSETGKQKPAYSDRREQAGLSQLRFTREASVVRFHPRPPFASQLANGELRRSLMAGPV